MTERFQDALGYAARIHAEDRRKGTTIPYIAHLLSVCSLILADGGSEDEAIAGLLHDTLEDHGDVVKPDELEHRFGRHVRTLVEGCSDTPPGLSGGDKPPWLERKLRYLAHLPDVPPEGLRVALADKLDNARAILADYRELGEALWSRFSVGREEQLWYYGALVRTLREARPPGRPLPRSRRASPSCIESWPERQVQLTVKTGLMSDDCLFRGTPVSAPAAPPALPDQRGPFAVRTPACSSPAFPGR